MFYRFYSLNFDFKEYNGSLKLLVVTTSNISRNFIDVYLSPEKAVNSGLEVGQIVEKQVLSTESSMNLDEEKVLIICPTSLIYNWNTEVKKFLPESSIQLYHGIDRGGVRVDSNIVISTYGTLLSDAMELSKAKFSMVFP